MISKDDLEKLITCAKGQAKKIKTLEARLELITTRLQSSGLPKSVIDAILSEPCLFISARGNRLPTTNDAKPREISDATEEVVNEDGRIPVDVSFFAKVRASAPKPTRHSIKQ